jgi:hypothetical protein
VELRPIIFVTLGPAGGNHELVPDFDHPDRLRIDAAIGAVEDAWLV